MMLGQNVDDARRVVLLIIDANGREYGWEILNPARVRWDNYAFIGNSAHATIHASGEFHRMSKSPRSREIEAQMIAAIESLEGEGPHELPG